MCLVGTPNERTFAKNLYYSYGITGLIGLSHEVDVLAMHRAMPNDICNKGWPLYIKRMPHILFLLRVLMVK
jgi:hypothetical protein